MPIRSDSIFDKSNQVIAKEIENEFIIIPISEEEMESLDELFLLNETAKELWEQLNGKRSVHQLIQVISERYQKDFHEQIREDIILLLKELLTHKIIIKVW